MVLLLLLMIMEGTEVCEAEKEGLGEIVVYEKQCSTTCPGS